MKDGKQRILKLALPLLIAAAPYRTMSAQQSSDPKKLQEDVSALKDEVKTLGEKQQQILDQLVEIKKLVQAGPAGLPALQLPATEDVQNDPAEGVSTAGLAIIEYTDFQCPFCEMFVNQTYPRIVTDFINTGKVRFFYRDLPDPSHPFAMSAARAARCAGEQGKFWQMHDSLFADQDALAYDTLVDRGAKLGLDKIKYNQCLSSHRYADAIQNNLNEAEKIGVVGTPTFSLGTVEPDGHTVKIEKAIQGAQSYDAFKSSLDLMLAQKERASTTPTKH